MTNFMGFENYFLIIIKGFFIIGSILNLIFSFIVVKQVTSMSKNIIDKFNYFLIIFSYIYLIISFVLVLTTLAL
jgi:hypothetical protein